MNTELAKQLRSIIKEELSLFLPDFKDVLKLAKSDELTLEEAVAFLSEIGYPIKKQYIYLLVNKNEIPYTKYRNTLLFNRDELTHWSNSRVKRKPYRERKGHLVSQK